MTARDLYNQVDAHYGSVARAANTSHSRIIAKAFGYSDQELDGIPKDANLGLSCGNPTAIASLREGETVIDLGSGAGFDVFLAAKQVGPSGRTIGVDMNEDMLARARGNAAKSSFANIDFIKAKITSIPLEANVADCIISNCVINLVPAPEKPTVFVEMFRLLKSGGRLAISDILARKPLPEELRRLAALHVGCVSGASTRVEYETFLKDAGFTDVLVVDTESDLNVYVKAAKDVKAKGGNSGGCCEPAASTTQQFSCCGESNAASISEGKPSACCSAEKRADGCCSTESPSTCCSTGKGETGCCSMSQSEASAALGLPHDINLNEWVGSFKIYAVKA